MNASSTVGGGLYGGVTVPATKPASLIVQAGNDLKDTITSLHEIINILEERLVPVVGDIPPANRADKQAEPVRHKLHERIAGEAERVRFARQRIESILERLYL